MVSLNRYVQIKDLCPCGSHKPIESCCLRSDNTIFTQPSRIKIRKVRAPYSNPRCYAAALGNCSKGISSGHYISKGVLLDLADPVPLTVRGFLWQKQPTLNLSPNALTANILCTTHNSALSCLDTVGKRLMVALSGVDRYFSWNNRTTRPIVHLFNGHDVERWLLKVLCGIVASGNAGFHDAPIEKSNPPLAWLQWLFGLEPLPEQWGLYLRSTIGGRVMLQKEFMFAPLVTSTQIVAGCIAGLNNINFLLAMTPPADNPGGLLKDAIYRPSSLQFVELCNGQRCVVYSGVG